MYLLGPPPFQCFIEQNPSGDTQELGEVSALQVFLGDATDDAPTLNKSAALQVREPLRSVDRQCGLGIQYAAHTHCWGRDGLFGETLLTLADVPPRLRVSFDPDAFLEVGPESHVCLQLLQG